MVGRGAHRLDADDADGGIDRFRGQRHAGDEPSAADGDDQRVGPGRLFEDLEAQGALARDDRGIGEGVDIGEVLRVGGLERGGVRVVQTAPSMRTSAPQARIFPALSAGALSGR